MFSRIFMGNKDKFFGINVSLEYVNESMLDTFIERVDGLSCGWVRLEFDWYSKQNFRLHDKFVKAMHVRGIKILGLLTGLVHATFKNLFFPHLKFRSPVKHEKDFLGFCGKICRRYSAYINTWEIWNEENTLRFWTTTPDADEYAMLLKNTIKVIKNIQPKAKIVLGGIFGNDLDTVFSSNRGYLARLIVQKATDEVDIYAFHPYSISCYATLTKNKKGYLKDAKDDINKFANAYAYTGKKMWITEYGVSSGYTFSMNDADIGWVYKQLLEHCRSKNIVLFIWTMMDMHSSRYSEFNPERVFGLLDKNMNKKDSYRVLAN